MTLLPRTSYIICGTQCKVKIEGPLVPKVGKNPFSFLLSCYLLCNVTLHPAQGYLLGKYRPSQMLTLPPISVHENVPDLSLPTPVCPGLGGWEQGSRRQEKPSWGAGTETRARRQVPSTCPIFSLDSLTKHNSKIKLLKFYDGDGRALNPN